MKWAGVWAIVGLYGLYTVIHFVGRDGSADYFFVNNDFFIVPMLGVALLVSVLTTVWAVRGHLRTPSEDRNLRVFLPAGVCLALTLLFVPFAFLVAFSEYLAT